jgi:hypothetical protein
VRAQQRDAGTYVLNFLGKPAAPERFGSYGLKVAETPPAPTVTLSANRTAITAGENVTLQWNATNATSCTASSGWTGTKAVSGTEQTGTLTANATFQIACSGPGGGQSASTTVTVNPPSRDGGGGGGAMDFLLLIYMCVFGGIDLTARRSPRAA